MDRGIKIFEGARRLPITPEVREYIWRKVGSFSELYPEGDKQRFCQNFSGNSLLFETENSIIEVDNVHFPGFAEVHGVFWSRSVFRQIALFKEIAKYIFGNLGIEVLITKVPARKKALSRFLHSVGFEHFKRLYRARRKGADIIDVDIFILEGKKLWDAENTKQ